MINEKLVEMSSKPLKDTDSWQKAYAIIKSINDLQVLSENAVEIYGQITEEDHGRNPSARISLLSAIGQHMTGLLLDSINEDTEENIYMRYVVKYFNNPILTGWLQSEAENRAEANRGTLLAAALYHIAGVVAGIKAGIPFEHYL